MKVKLYRTMETGETLEETAFWQPGNGVENEVLNIYEDTVFQTFEGFGGAITDAAGFVFAQMNEEQQDTLLSMYFDDENMGYNQMRIPLDSCDFSTHVYEADSDEADENLERFSFADTERYILPMLEAAEKKAGKKLKLMLSPWSPPAYMKTNQSRMQGGSLKPEYRERWAEYLCRYVEEFQSRGYEVARLSIQNEPKAAQTWDSCQYSAREEKEFLRDILAPALQRHGLGEIELFIWDHNKERIYERARDILDETTVDLVAGIAYHWYSGDHFEGLDLVNRKFPDKKLILSESCLEFGKYDREEQLENAERLAHDMIGNLNHGMTASYDWNILLDREGGPNHKGNFCDAPYLYDTDTKELEERKILRYYWHFAHVIRPGAVRLGISRYTDRLDFTAWKNPDGTMAFVLLNRSGESLPCQIRCGKEKLVLTAAPHSITSGVMNR